MTRKKICILAFSQIAWDSRVLREAESARHHYEVDVVAFGEWEPFAGVCYHRLEKTKRSWLYLTTYFFALLAGRLHPKLYERAFWMKQEFVEARTLLIRGEYDLIHANDWNALPIAVSVARNSKSRVLFDAHEYSLTEEGDNWLWKFLIVPFREYLFKTYQEPLGALVTVSRGISELYNHDYGWEMEIILNAPAYIKSEFRAVQADRIRLVHHGAAVDTRYLEDFIRLVSLLDGKFELNFYLLPAQPRYLAYLKKLALREEGRINFFEPMHTSNLLGELAKFDIGIPLLAATQSTYYNALPNKFFDFIMAGLAVAVSPLPMMQEIVDLHTIGVVSVDQKPESLARSLNALPTDLINLYKRNSLELAKDLNAGVEMKKLMKIYGRLLT